jgi:hypothetical protein
VNLANLIPDPAVADLTIIGRELVRVVLATGEVTDATPLDGVPDVVEGSGS